MKSVLTIAGSDPSGGAGVQSDLRTFAALGVAGLSAISAITIQNSTGVQSVNPVDSTTLKAQISSVLKDTTPDAIKIGMLGGPEQVSVVTFILERSLKNVVLDPVLASSGGVPLLDSAGRYLLLTTLLPLCDIVTPNLDEAAALTGTVVDDTDSILRAGERLLSMGSKAVLIKGGHLTSEPVDWLFRQDYLPIEFAGERVKTVHTHGTGCLLSSAIAAYLAQGEELPVAILYAKALVHKALSNPTTIGKGRGYPNPVQLENKSIRTESRSHAARIELFRGIYVVTDPTNQRGRSVYEIVRAALFGGAQIIQFRDKTMNTQELVETASKLSNLVRDHGKLFIINDRVDVALASDADGVHLGPDDIHPRDARRLLGPNKLVGVSTGTVAEAVAAAPYASYFGVGCIFGTKTKLDAGDPIGPWRVAEIKGAVPGIPTVAIGGITESNIGLIVEVGASAAAVVSAVVGAENVEAATRRLVTLFS